MLTAAVTRASTSRIGSRCFSYTALNNSNSTSSSSSSSSESSSPSSTSSSSTTTTTTTKRTDKNKKVEHLINVYHASSSFFSPDITNEYVDRILSPSGDIRKFKPRFESLRHVLDSMYHTLNPETLSRSKVYGSKRATWDDQYVIQDAMAEWTPNRRYVSAHRMRKVIDTLHGTSANRKPGLDTILENDLKKQ